MTTLIIFHSLNFIIFFFLDHIIKGGFFGSLAQSSYYKYICNHRFGFSRIYIIVFVIILTVLSLFSYLGNHVELMGNPYEHLDLWSHMSNNSAANGGSSNVNVTASATNTSLNFPNLGISVPTEGLNNVAAAGSAAGGVALAMRAAKNMPGGPGIKAAVACGTYAAVQGTTLGMSKILNTFSKGGSDNKYINSLNMLSNNDNSNITELYNSFPLNLLTDINLLVDAELIFLLIIFNTYVVRYLTTIDYDKYIPQTNIGKFLKIIINRYTKF